MISERSSGFLALTGLVAMMAQAWLSVVTGNPSSLRAAVLLVGVAAAVWALANRAPRAGAIERLVVTLGATIALWIGLLEIVLRLTVPMARGFLLLITLAAAHAAVLYVSLGPPDTPGRPTDRRVGRLTQGVLAAIAVLLGTFTLLEAGVRAVSPVRSYELVPDEPSAGPCLLRAPDGRLVGVPGCTGRYVHRDFPDLRVELNALGLRDGADETTGPEDGTPSVLVVGDSFAFGMGVALDETFQQVLQRRLGDSLGAEVRVFGAAAPGSGPGHQHAVIEELAPLTRPDLIVLALFEGNDLQDQQAALARRREPGEAQRAEPISPWRFLASTTTWPFWRTSSSLLQLRRVDGRPTLVLQRALEEPPDESIDPLLDAVLVELEAIDATARRLGAELVVLLVPGRVQVDPESFETFAARHPERTFSRRGFHDRLAQEISSRGIPVVDPLARLEADALAGQAAYHPEGHWNRHGHAVAAGLLVGAVGSRIADPVDESEPPPED